MPADYDPMAFFIFMNIEEIEVWKDVPEYEGLYQVSSFGRVKSIIQHNGTNERLLALSTDGHYFKVSLYKKGQKVKCIKVHVLVAMAFNGHKPDGTQNIVVDHKDNNPLNNRADNLQLIPQRENVSKDQKNGTSKYTGVSWDKNNKKWTARIEFKRRVIVLGTFELEIDAKNAYQKALEEWKQGLDLNIIYPKKVKTSKYKGVYLNKKTGKWAAMYKRKWLGLFMTELEAHEEIKKYIAKLNLIV